MRDVFEQYLAELYKIPLDEQTEHTGRAALETLLKTFAEKAPDKRLTVQHEPKRLAGTGAPDFKISRAGMILGYVENKGVGANLDQVLKSDQIKRYRALSANLILTDYLHWVWIKGDVIQRETLCHATDLDDRKFRPREDRVDAVAKLLEGFFSTAPEGIAHAERLALALAVRSRLLRDFLGEELVRQEGNLPQRGRLYGLYDVFRSQVFHELTLAEFADAFAQMLAYGLFLARLNSGANAVTLNNSREFVPGSFRLIRELIDFLTVLEGRDYGEIRWVVEEVLSIVNGLDLNAIHEDLSFRHRKVRRGVRAASEEEARLFERDPFIYFYEDFLKAYDKATRKSRGVYYTPPPIVNFIVRAIDDILKDTFGIADGLADHRRVTVLDFACGTGTFLLEIFQRIFDNIGGADSGRADLIVRQHMLKNLFGFEYLIAPYTIAHLKLSQYLADQGHPLAGDERLQVFLTNTLEPVEPQANLLLPAVTAEVEAAQKVKDREILVITGNPPYSGISRNMGDTAKALMERYKYVDGEHFGERKHWLHDDYVKFIAFAQSKMDEVEEGVVGIITNHAWIYNPTFRGMRQSLMKSFQQIVIIDLHGSSKPKELPPHGLANENVFDIMKGVAVTLLVKGKNLEPGIWFGEIWGRRSEKYRVCASARVAEIGCKRIDPEQPYYFFSPHTAASASDWSGHIPIDQIFNVQSTGMLTARDRLNIGFDQKELIDRLRTFATLKVDEGQLSG